MAKFHKKNEKRGPVTHKVFSDRGLRLERASSASQCSSLNYGQSVIVGQKSDGQDVVVKIGHKCPTCRFRVRGFNHAEGAHHKGMVNKRSRR